MKFPVSFFFLLFLIGNQSTHAQRPTVLVNVKLLTEDKDRRTIMYHSARPLKIEDFKGRPDLSSEAVAVTSSGLKMNISSLTEGNKITLNISLICYFDPYQSWMKPRGKNARVLEHEQKHFDITAIQTCRLLEAIKSYRFSANWHEELMELRKRYVEELSNMQGRYDKFTNHGISSEKQKEYNQLIEKQLRESGCF